MQRVVKSGRTAAADLAIRGVSHQFGSARAVDGVDLHIAAGEFVSLLGPSGCGKTTLLRILAGFERQTAGNVLIGGESVDHLPAGERGVGIVFQSYALFPHMTVVENIAYGLEARRASVSHTRERVALMVDLVKLQGLETRRPRELSGGQQQRVALARVLAIQPRILLLDEPFAALDKNLRLDMQIEVKRLQRQFGITAILVTHDQDEALSMADRVAVMQNGRLRQVGTPDELYSQPSSYFVNTFVGVANTLRGRVIDKQGTTLTLDVGAGMRLRGMAADSEIGVGDAVRVCIRPEAMRFATSEAALHGSIDMILPLGPIVVYEVTTAAGTPVKVTSARESGRRLAVGDEVGLTAPVSACRVYRVEND